MPRFRSYDGTELAYQVVGEGPALICLPGGPARSVAYLGDLGGLSKLRRLIMLDSRGSGESASPTDPASYRCDRMVADVEALRAHLGLAVIDLIAHSAGANLAVLYAAAHPERIRRLLLITPGLRALGIQVTDEQQRRAMMRRSNEPWYAEAVAAAEKAETGDRSLETMLGYLPFLYGRWDDAARAHALIGMSERSRAARDGFYAAGAFEPETTRTALLAMTAPVLIYAGETDVGPTPEIARDAAHLFPNADVAVQPGAGHFPWLDNAATFSAAIESFLS
jgi:pimeloyl-ACP methyl ester carboxylesterase